MDQNALKVTYGGWYQRTTLHLSEIYDFFERGHSSLPLSKEKLSELFARLDLANVTREVGHLEFVKATTKSGIEIRYYEDGLYILEIESDKIEDAQIKLKKYFEESLGPAVAYIFSLGAPTPKVLANIKSEHPTVVTGAPAQIQKLVVGNNAYGEVYSKISSKNIEVYKTPNYIFISASPELATAIAHITETQIFFREFKDQLEKYLNIHRTIWEEISHIKERQMIRAKEIDGLRGTLDSYQKTINLISSRINQMGAYAQTRSSIAKNLNIEEYLVELFQYKFEVLSDTLAYIKEIWKMTSEYLTTAINILVEVKNQGVKSSVQSLQIITSIGVVSGIIGYFSRSEFPRFTQTGALYFVVIIAFTLLVNSAVNYIYQHKKYRLKFVEAKKDL